MSAPTRWVIVDDTSPKIEYKPSSHWFPNGSLNGIEDYGAPYSSTLHGTRDKGSSLAYKFSGTSIRVWGTFSNRNLSDPIDPEWECIVDNHSIDSASAPKDPGLICPETRLRAGRHNLVVKTTEATNQTFWFDRIDYVPTPDVFLGDKAILVNNTDPDIQFGEGWSAYGDYARGTSTQGSTFVFSFYGVSVAWYGYTSGDLAWKSSVATWQIDNYPPQSFIIEGQTNRSQFGSNKKFFETMSFSESGPHRLLVTHNGTSQTTPLNLLYLICQNCSSLTRSGCTSTTTNGGCTTHAHGVIAGSVIGVVGILALLIFIYFFVRRRRSPKRKTTRDIFDPAFFTTSDPHLQGATSRHPNGRIDNLSIPSQLIGKRPAPDIRPYRLHPSIYSYHQAEGQFWENAKVRFVRVSNPDDESYYGRIVFDNPSSVSDGLIEVPRIAVHQDSGARLHAPPGQAVISVPPHYTPL